MEWEEQRAENLFILYCEYIYLINNTIYYYGYYFIIVLLLEILEIKYKIV